MTLLAPTSIISVDPSFTSPIELFGWLLMMTFDERLRNEKTMRRPNFRAVHQSLNAFALLLLYDSEENPKPRVI